MAQYKKDDIYSRDCYKIENEELIGYRAIATCIKNFQNFKHTHHFKDFEELTEYNNLLAKPPIDNNGYCGWGLHYMYFLKNRGCLSDFKFELLNYPFHKGSYFERKISIINDIWLKKKELEYGNKMQIITNQVIGIYPVNKCIIKQELFNEGYSYLFIPRKEFDWSNYFMLNFIKINNIAIEKQISHVGAYLILLKENGYISHYEIMYTDNIPLILP